VASRRVFDGTLLQAAVAHEDGLGVVADDLREVDAQLDLRRFDP
jgi:hypothetical protein